jgi:ribosomal protein S18 acetylase RimI-like enzyme
MKITEPQSPDDFNQYYDLRWRILRAPWKQPQGSEKDEYEDKSYHLMVRSDGGELMGIGRMHFIEAETAQIRFMAVDEPFRGMGIGRLILDHLEKIAFSRGARRILLNARIGVVDFYQKSGYSIIGDGPTLFGQIRHFIMEKELAP